MYNECNRSQYKCCADVHVCMCMYVYTPKECIRSRSIVHTDVCMYAPLMSVRIRSSGSRCVLSQHKVSEFISLLSQ